MRHEGRVAPQFGGVTQAPVSFPAKRDLPFRIFVFAEVQHSALLAELNLGGSLHSTNKERVLPLILGTITARMQARFSGSVSMWTRAIQRRLNASLEHYHIMLHGFEYWELRRCLMTNAFALTIVSHRHSTPFRIFGLTQRPV